MLTVIWIVYILLSYLVGRYAQNHGASIWLYFILSLVLTPVIGFVVFLVVGGSTLDTIGNGKRCAKVNTQDINTQEDIDDEMEDVAKPTSSEFVQGQSKVICPNCGQEVLSFLSKCPNCGSELNK